MRGFDHALDRDRAQVGNFQIVTQLELLDRGRIKSEAETRRVLHQSEKDLLAHGAERLCLRRPKTADPWSRLRCFITTSSPPIT